MTHFIGIDVSKQTLDLALVVNNELKISLQIENNATVVKQTIKKITKQYCFSLQQTLFCMEHTGIYNNHLIAALQHLKASIWLENPIHIKYSLGLQ